MTSVLPTPIVHDIEQVDKEDDSQISASTWMMRLHFYFPLFNTDESYHAYHSFCLEQINPIHFVPSVCVYIALSVCRWGLAGFGMIYFDRDESNLFVGLRLTALVLYLFTIAIWALYCTVHFLRLKGHDQMYLALISRWKKLTSLEDLLVFMPMVCWSIFLILRVLKGQCVTKSWWDEQFCNPFANSGGIPTEMVYTLYMIPLCGQLIMKCVSLRVLTMSYLLCSAVVAFCIFYSKSNDYFALINVLIFINATFEITRLQRVYYVEMLKVQKHQKIVLTQIKQEQVTKETIREQELLLHRAEDEKRLKDKEAFQLRSLMGNVAHDLKTPLFVLEADVETLKRHYSYLDEDAIRDATIRIRESSNMV